MYYIISYYFHSSIHDILSEKSDFPSFINIEVSHRTQMCLHNAMTAGLKEEGEKKEEGEEKEEGEKKEDGIIKCNDNDGFEAISSEENLPISHLMR